MYSFSLHCDLWPLLLHEIVIEKLRQQLLYFFQDGVLIANQVVTISLQADHYKNAFDNPQI